MTGDLLERLLSDPGRKFKGKRQKKVNKIKV